MMRNGFDLERYQGMVEALRQQPRAAEVRFNSRFDWDDGFRGTARAISYQQGGGDHPRSFVFRCDVPSEMLGSDSGSMPAERMLSALAHCLGTSFAVQATKRGVNVEAIQVELQGDVDLCGFLELDSVRPGLSSIGARIRVASSATEAELQEVGRAAARFSPMHDSLAQPVPIAVTVERA